MTFLRQNSFTDYADKFPEVPLLPRNSQNKKCEVYGCATHVVWIEAVVLGIKNFKFLPTAERAVGQWVGLIPTHIGQGYATCFIRLGMAISKSETGLSKAELQRIGYKSKYRIYPIVERRVLNNRVYVCSGNTSCACSRRGRAPNLRTSQ